MFLMEEDVFLLFRPAEVHIIAKRPNHICYVPSKPEALYTPGMKSSNHVASAASILFMVPKFCLLVVSVVHSKKELKMVHFHNVYSLFYKKHEVEIRQRSRNV